MIPTQPSIPNPFEVPNDTTWRPGTAQMWQCPYCYQWLGNAQYHNCQGERFPQPVTTSELTIGGNGMMAEFQMYGDFKKLLRNDTLAKFRERFLAGLLDLEQNTPEELGGSGLAIDAIMDIFDDVAKGINHNTDL